MSSLAPAAPGALRASLLTRAQSLRSTPDVALGLALAAALVLLAFITTGGVDLGPNTWAEIVLCALGALAAAAVLVLGARGRRSGGATVTLFIALAVLTAVSVAWSVQPANSWVEANRTLSYLAAFGGAAALARLFPERWPAIVGAIGVLASAICAYALVVKVFPTALDPSDPVGRVRAPFDYWNATGLIAAIGVPACLWSGARPEGGRVLRALSVPAVAVLLSVLVLSYSRSTLLAAVLGLGLWFAVVPLRLRAAAVLLAGAVGAALITGWALATHPITHDFASNHARATAGRAFGLVLVLVLALSIGAGFVVAFAIDRLELSEHARRTLGTALVTLVALLPAGGLVALAGSSRGFTGEVSHIWNTLTSPYSGVGNNPGRLVELGNSRPRYWKEGLRVGEHAMLAGVGAGGYGTARTRWTKDRYVVGYAHSYLIETFADFGLIGLAANLALLVAWGVAALRAVGGRARWEQRTGAERTGLVTLFAIVVIFGVHSAIDWTWFIPGTAVPALVCAGWLAGRGRLAEPIGRVGRPRRLTDHPAIAAAVVVLAGVVLLAAWTIWQPLRSTQADSRAIAALTAGHTDQALRDAQDAQSDDPVAVEPLFELSAIYSTRGDGRAALTELRRAVNLQPANPVTWETLGEWYLQHNRAGHALTALMTAHRLDLSNFTTVQEIKQASAALGQR